MALSRLAVLAAMAFGMPAAAQCDRLMPGPVPMPAPGLNPGGGIGAITTWDPDGAGPQPALLVVAGSFSRIAGVFAHRVAAWNGVHWAPLDDPGGAVTDLAVFNGSLIACGQIPGNVARLVPGQGWVQFALPLTGPGVIGVECMAVYNGELIVAGEFQSIAGVSALNIARWNGSIWRPLGIGMGGGTFPRIHALAVFNNDLVAAGRFAALSMNNIARWDGTNWWPLGTGVMTSGSPTGATIYALAVHQGSLIAGGKFTHASGVSASGIARWNGSAWQPLGTGVVGQVGGLGPEVRALTVHNGWLLAGGIFSQAGLVATQSLARWSGTDWSAMGIGLAHPLGAQVFTLGTFGNDAYVAGSFETAGGLEANDLARWTGSTWLPVESPWFVYAMATLGPRIVAAGHFAFQAGPTAAYHIAAWNGSTVSPLGGGLNNQARALMSFVHPGPLGAHELVAGGLFTTAGGVTVNRIARWVEDPLVAFPPPAWEPMGAGFNDTVYAIERFNGTTAATGTFTMSGGTAVSRIARWDGATWSPITTGLNDAGLALKWTPGTSPLNTTLVVGGSFTMAGGVSASRIARWTENLTVPGGSWSAMGSGFNNTVRAVERFNNATYAAGDFTASGATAVNRIARWTGSAWVDVGGGFDGPVYALRAMDGFLFAGGAFTTAGGVPAARLARWDGVSWAAVDGGAVSSVFALRAYQGEMHAGGVFWVINGGSTEAAGWARYSPTGVPWIAAHPLARQVACGGTAVFDVSIPQGYSGVQIQWRKDGTPLTSGPTGSGSTVTFIPGLSGGSVAIANVSQADQGTYDAVVANTCGSVTSAGATLTVTGTCPGCYPDCNGDLLLNLADFGCFQTKFALQNSYADCNGDGALNLADFGCFQTKFALGCP